MTKSEIIAELRRMAMGFERPIRIESTSPIFHVVETFFMDFGGQSLEISVDENTFRWFLLLVAEALETT